MGEITKSYLPIFVEAKIVLWRWILNLQLTETARSVDDGGIAMLISWKPRLTATDLSCKEVLSTKSQPQERVVLHHGRSQTIPLSRIRRELRKSGLIPSVEN
ncbi:hypothetical protein L484_003692 [Morus notabilis]|uniref:Uncharacterized protein n=1 Tax=Morus notabilis TaxID=981085 RepID=W9SAI0_9ROSA|nr:hypothetical protein L484_003692 [Morus notabilis]